MSKKIKLDKKTARLLATMGDLLKDTGEYELRYKGKKKDKKRVKKGCVHAYTKSGQIRSLITNSTLNPGDKVCRFCDAEFPLIPMKEEEYAAITKQYNRMINQLIYWIVSFGGDSDSLQTLLQVRNQMPKVVKTQMNILKAIMKRKEIEYQKMGNAFDDFASSSGEFNFKYS